MIPGLESCLQQFAGKRSLREAKVFVRGLVLNVGPGFHPDTEFRDYVTSIKPLRRSYSKADAKRLQAGLDRAISIFERWGKDICGVALPVQRRLILELFRESKEALARERQIGR